LGDTLLFKSTLPAFIGKIRRFLSNIIGKPRETHPGGAADFTRPMKVGETAIERGFSPTFSH
jgi:hypothetical protein